MKTDIVAVFFVGFARIAQADDEFHFGSAGMRDAELR